MSAFGITGFGAYVPRLRIERAAIAAAHAWMAPGLRGAAKGSRAYCGWDEDSITMAVEAARDCLGTRDRKGVTDLVLASTTLPYADLQNSGIVAEALGLEPTVGTMDVGHSQRAGVSALINALRLGRSSLVVASERPVGKPASVQEISFGAGAAAFTLGSEAPLAILLGAATSTRNFVDHFRAAGSDHDYYWEERWIRDEGYLKLAPPAINAALRDAGIAASDVTHFVLPALQKGFADAVAKAVGVTCVPADNLADGCGYAGAAQALLMLAGVLETAKPGDVILVAAFGQGVDALVLRVTAAIETFRPRLGVAGALADGLKTDSYMRMLTMYGGVDLEWGMRAEKSGKTILTEQYRSSDQTAGFIAGKCRACGTMQFPQLQYCVNPPCNQPRAQFDQVCLTDEPHAVLTYTADWLSYHPAPPLYVGFVQFENGARLLMEIVDVGPEGIDIGTPLRNVFRIKEVDKVRGYGRYFWKSTPVSASRGG
jgi:3-hydroxy-3-methylglutaryl CoA synthase